MLKQSTSVIVLIGPVLDSSGVAYTGMAIADLNITKNGSTAAMSGNTFSHSHEGHYLLTLTTTNTNTLGNLVISCNKSTYAMPPARFRVLHANVYDVTFGSTAPSTYAGGDTSGVTTLLSRVTGAVALASALVTAQTSLDAINTKTTNLPTDPADQSLIISATDALLAAINALNDLSAAEVRTELNTELGRIDTTVSSRATPAQVATALTDYDPPTKAEMDTGFSLVATAANLTALAGKFTGITLLARWLGMLAGKTADATTLAEINATTAGAAFDNTRESLEAIRDRGDTAWSGGGGGGSTTVVVAPVVGTIQFNTITASGTVQAFQYCPLPTGPITLVDGNDDPVDVSAGKVKMICVDTKDASKTFTLTTDEGDGLTVAGADGNQISVDYLPELAGLYERKTFHRPVGGEYQVREFGFWNIVPGPDPRDA